MNMHILWKIHADFFEVHAGIGFQKNQVVDKKNMA
jgi:hypothetical protein